MIPQIPGTGSAGVDMDFNGEDEDGVEREEDERVDENGFAVGLHATELKLLPVPRKGEKQPRLEQHEQNYPDQHRCPISHFLSDPEN
ncbi:hypothetical protein JHK87_044313 [Glycine soja]|nr:hypothetical protein JHK86_044484 [Glycine max]KAG4940442.1 hypothetical protein JHK87_044313 [Glycine soja]